LKIGWLANCRIEWLRRSRHVAYRAKTMLVAVARGGADVRRLTVEGGSAKLCRASR